MVQMIDCLPSKQKVQVQNSSMAKKKKLGLRISYFSPLCQISEGKLTYEAFVKGSKK
jgi:hypothetical protein